MHSHTHGHSHDHSHDDGAMTRRALAWSLALNGGFLVIEAGIGLYTGSLALLSDAAHMVSDVGALVLALGAAHLAQRAADSERTWGYVRAETLGAFINGLALLVACAILFKEAFERMAAGAPAIEGWPVLVAGVIGLAINLGSAWWLWRADRESLNIRGALIHMLADALGSAGAIVSALLLMRGVYLADPVVSLFIGGLVLWGTWGLLRDSGRVLLQYAPPGMQADEVRATLLGVDGVEGVHDLHLWTLDGRSAVLSAHLLGAAGVPAGALRLRAQQALDARFGSVHTTLQVEFAESGACVNLDCPLLQRRTAPAPDPAAPDPQRHHDHDHQGHDHHGHR